MLVTPVSERVLKQSTYKINTMGEAELRASRKHNSSQITITVRATGILDLRAEKRGFNGGDPLQDWLEAEKEVNAMLDMVEN